MARQPLPSPLGRTGSDQTPRSIFAIFSGFGPKGLVEELSLLGLEVVGFAVALEEDFLDTVLEVFGTFGGVIAFDDDVWATGKATS